MWIHVPCLMKYLREITQVLSDVYISVLGLIEKKSWLTVQTLVFFDISFIFNATNKKLIQM